MQAANSQGARAGSWTGEAGAGSSDSSQGSSSSHDGGGTEEGAMAGHRLLPMLVVAGQLVETMPLETMPLDLQVCVT